MDGLEDETFEEMQKTIDWQKKSAKKLGVTMKEFTDAAVESQEAVLQDMVDEVSGNIGVDPGKLMSTVYMFQDRTQRAADELGMQHEEFLGAVFEVRCTARQPCTCMLLHHSRKFCSIECCSTFARVPEYSACIFDVMRRRAHWGIFTQR